jgi:HD-GYP domain-containing protein (c-di-GMP phosphodiesterase class II)
VLYHHERWDGTGYPSGKAGEEIPLEARVLAIADAFDAMTSDRPYRRALTQDEALAEVDRCAGTQFDPRIAEVFLALFAETELAVAASA